LAQGNTPPLLSMINLPTILGDSSAAADEHFWQNARDLRVSVPVIVVSFNATNQTVTVQPAIQENILRNGVVVPVNLPQLPNVVLGMFRSAGFSIVATPQPGDEGWVIFADMCIDSWWQQGVPSITGNPPPAMPNQVERRRHDLSDGMFLPVGWSQPRLLPSYPATGLQVRSDDGTTVIDVTEGEVTITPDGGTTELEIVPGTTTVKGNLVVTGSLTVDTNLTIDGTINSTGDVSAPDFVSGTITLTTHAHGGVANGSGVTGGPFG
jgi:phage baseplate assembly protein gpV